MNRSLDTFFGAWSTADDAARAEAITRSMSPDATYGDPMTPELLVGPAAVAQYVSAFAANAPGATAQVVDAQDRHGTTRATVAFTMADGAVQHGQYFVEFEADDRISRMFGFVGLGQPG